MNSHIYKNMSSKSFIFYVLTYLFLIIFSSALNPQYGLAYDIMVSWDPSSSSDVAGYRLYYGTQSRRYSWQITIDSADQLSCGITDLDDGINYYFAVTAFGHDYEGNIVESNYSEEISYISDSVLMILNNRATGQVNSWRLSSDGSYRTGGAVYDEPINTAWVISGMGDIDQDGTADLILNNRATGQVNFWLLDSDGSYRTGGAVYEEPINTAWVISGMGDIDQDGTADLILNNRVTGQVNFWLLDADGSYRTGGAVYDEPINTAWVISGMGDIDQDGTADLILNNRATGQVNFWLLDADGSYRTGGAVYEEPINTAWVISGMGDIDQDGTVDLILNHRTSGLVYYWLLNADGSYRTGGPVYDEPISTAWVISGMADIDRDGTIDLILNHRTSGLVYYWFLNADGSYRTGGAVYEEPINTAWVISGIGN